MKNTETKHNTDWKHTKTDTKTCPS